MSKIKGEYIPTEDDVKNLESWVVFQENAIMSPPKLTNSLRVFESLNQMQESIYLGPFTDFYQTSIFPFIMNSDKCINIVNFKYIKSEKNFKKFINNSQYLIHRCLVFDNACPKTKQKYFGVYYHRDFGKVGWLKGRLQFILPKLCSESFIHWFYGIKKFKFPHIQINVVNK